MVDDTTTRPLPERVTMGLLPYLNAHALDEDYAQAAERRAVTGSARSRPRIGSGGAAVLLVFAVLAVTAAVQTSRNSASEEQQRQELIGQVTQRRSVVTAQQRSIARLQAQNQRLENDLFRNSDNSAGLLSEVNLLGLLSGTAPATGPGVEIIADDAPNAQSDRNRVLDTDLQKLVNGLWQAGAEAISINGERLTALSAIRHAGSSITVNFTSLGRPYRILAIGNSGRLPAKFAETTSGQAWLDLWRQVGLRFSIRPESSLSLPGTGVPQLRYARPTTNGKQGKGTP